MFAGALAAFWEEVIRPEMVTADAAETSRRQGDPRPAVRWQHATTPLPFFTGQLSAIVLVNALERAEDPQALLDEARRVAGRVYVVTPHLWTPSAWLDPRNRWIRVGPRLLAVPWRKERPVEIPTGVQVAGRHLTPLDSARKVVEQGVTGLLT